MGCAPSRSGAISRTKVVTIDPSKPVPETSATPTSIGGRIRAVSADIIGLRRQKEPRKLTSSAKMRSTISGSEFQHHRLPRTSAFRNSRDSGIDAISREQSAKKRERLPPLTDLANEWQAEDEAIESLGSTQNDDILKSTASPIRRLKPSDQTKILDSLRQEGLLNDPSTSTQKGGLVYEVPLGDLQKAKMDRLPARLQKLEERREEMALTKATLVTKLAEAEQRRKRREHEKVERWREKDAKNLQVKLALMDFEKEKERKLQRQLDDDILEKESRRRSQLDATVSKQKDLDSRGDEVRRRKNSVVDVDEAAEKNSEFRLSLN